MRQNTAGEEKQLRPHCGGAAALNAEPPLPSGRESYSNEYRYAVHGNNGRQSNQIQVQH